MLKKWLSLFTSQRVSKFRFEPPGENLPTSRFIFQKGPDDVAASRVMPFSGLIQLWYGISEEKYLHILRIYFHDVIDRDNASSKADLLRNSTWFFEINPYISVSLEW